MRFGKQHHGALTALSIGLGVELWLALMTFIVYGARPDVPHWIELLARGSQRPGSRLLAPLAFRLYVSYGDWGQFACFVLLGLIQGLIYGLGIYLMLMIVRYFSTHSGKRRRRAEGAA
jgi:hypothetical protein